MDAPISRAGRGWMRGVRPLLWWLLLVLVLYGIRTHQQLSEQTRLYYSISLNGQPLAYYVAITFDGEPIKSGDNIWLGSHRFEVTGPNTDPFATNFAIIWYGRHELGEIRLKRSTGALSVKAFPPAQVIAISGPEVSTNLPDSSGAILTVPTGSYTVSAQYRHWSDSQMVPVSRDTMSPATFSPRFGALRLTCNKNDATYRLEFDNGQSVDSGNLPATVIDLPTGSYRLTIGYHNRQTQKFAVVEASVTNEVPIQFVYGAAQLETVPSGAEVLTANGNYLGQTPLLLPDMTPQTAQFNLSLSGYEPVSVTLEIAADQTNVCRTNLVSIGYLSAMQETRTYLAASNYESAVQAASAALNSKPDDADALALQNQAKDRLNAEQQRLDQLTRPKRAFDSLCGHYQDAGLFAEHEFKTSKPAKELAVAIVNSLTNAVGAFQILYNDSPEPQAYEVVAQRTFSLGILGGTERDCLLVVGQAKDDETQIWFKVLEYQVQHTVTSNGLLNYHDNKQLIAVSPSRMQVTDMLQVRVQEGVQTVMGKIQRAIGQ
jgi:hypothetical protein